MKKEREKREKRLMSLGTKLPNIINLHFENCGMGNDNLPY